MTTQTLQDSELVEIVERASSISERLNGPYTAEPQDAGSKVVETRFREWCQTVAKGDQALIRQRLRWDRLDVDALRGALGRVRLVPGTPLPDWAGLLADVVARAAELDGDEQAGERFFEAEYSIPFEQIVAPFVLVARDRLQTEAGSAYELLGSAAHANLERSLLSTLSWNAGEALFLQFSIERAKQQSPLARLIALASNDNDSDMYEQFVRDMLAGKLVPFFREYAVLARLLSTITFLWVESNAEFLTRLEADRDDIVRIFGGDAELGPVASVSASLSDPHHGRRGVLLVQWEGGLKLVYKPKDLATEEAYIRLLGWLNERGAPLPFKLMAILNRGTHGWVEFISNTPCRTVDEAQRYFRRSGMLLCLGYALEATDLHYENVIASGEHPVVVDMEAMMHHRARPFDEDESQSARMLAVEQLANSVLRLGMLPDWQTGKDKSIAYDISALGAADAQDVPYKMPKWENINSDRMQLEYVQGKMQNLPNRPRLDEMPLTLAEYGDDLMAGFREMYQFLLDHRDELLAADSPLHELGRQEVRFIFRATRIYALIGKQLLAPAQLRDGADRSIRLELLGRAGLPPWAEPSLEEEPPPYWPIFAFERATMERTDIPFFSARPNSDTLELDDAAIPGFFVEPSFDVVVRRIKELGPDDLERQLVIMRSILYTHLARDMRATQMDAAPAEADGEYDDERAREALVAEALAIAEQLDQRAIRAPDGSAVWIGPVYNIQAERYQLRPAGYDLYNGTGGIGLFLAAVDRITGDTRYRELALGAMQPLQNVWKRYSAQLADEIGIGGASGLGSVVYSLVRMSQLLDEPALLEDARQAALLITPERIAEDPYLDIIAGAAGACLGLLTLYDVAPDDEILERARACGDHLLKARVESEAGYLAWPTLDRKLMTGFSHGAAGIAFALLRLHGATGEAVYLEAAREGIDYERSVFSPEAGNWPDFREEQPAFMSAWCHGAPGIGLARVGTLPLLETPDIHEDIEAAISTTERLGALGTELVCCGAFGRLELLLTAGGRLARPGLEQTARRHAVTIVGRAQRRGWYSIHHLLPEGVYSPSFFRGTAGIGYELLRMAHPDKLPSVLSWE